MKTLSENTPPKVKLPLSLLAPLALIAAVAIATWWTVSANRKQVATRLKQQTIANLTLAGASLETMFERAFRSGDNELIQEEMSVLAANRDYTFAALTDEANQVTHSMRLAEVGDRLDQLLPDAYKKTPQLQADRLAERYQKLGGNVDSVPNSQTVIATFPLVLGIEEGELRPSRIGNLILIRDYSWRLANELNTVNRNAINHLLAFALIAIALGLFFHFAIARRLSRLAFAAEQFGSGRREKVETGVGGNDEVARLAWAMDRMMAQKAEADREIVESEQRLQSILESAIDSIITIDRLGIIQSANSATTRLFGYGVKEIVGKNVSMLMPSPYAEAHDGYLANYMRTGNKKIIGIGREVEGLDKSGTRFPIDLTVSEVVVHDTTFFLGVVRDISEAKKAEGSLRVQQRAIESAVNGILITDPNQPDNPIVYVNPAVLKTTGYTLDEVVGKNCRFLQNDDREQEAIDTLRRAIKEEQECTVVLQNYKKDGTPFWNELTVSPVRDGEGKLVNFVGIQSDITKRIRVEKELETLNLELETRIEERTQELKAAQHELVQSEKMVTLGQVSGGIAHEIKNPLNAIKTSAYYLLNAKNASPEKVTEHLQRIDRQVNLADNVISALSKFAKLPEPEVRPTKVEQCLKDSLATIALPGNIEVEIDVPSDAPDIMVDDGQIMIVFRNLIRNARDAMPEGGKLKLGAVLNGQFVSIFAEDSGEGIPTEILDHVLEPLYTTKARGMGLGLAISNAIVKKHDGELSVTSEVGAGSRFVVKLKSSPNEQG